MSFYEEQILPRILNVVMSAEFFNEERRKCLAGVQGSVLEVGFGSGLNLPHYPAGVEKVVAIDPSIVSARLARTRIDHAPFPVAYLALRGEDIPSPDASFDSIVSTFTLCTIPDVDAALLQIRRVLKPGGRFFFVEHGRSSELSVQRWQDRLNGLQRLMCGGCNLNRDMERLIANAGFSMDSLEKYYAKGPRFSACMYRGVAR